MVEYGHIAVKLGDAEALGYGKQIAEMFNPTKPRGLGSLVQEKDFEDLDQYSLAIGVLKSLPPDTAQRLPVMNSLASILHDALLAGGLSAPIVPCTHCGGATVWVGRKH